ncbi:MAG: hypothetical protein R3335_15000, partial [Anaerolineales bacterium]|nr:hypothetical protein [Anaerolineales bacterium]
MKPARIRGPALLIFLFLPALAGSGEALNAPTNLGGAAVNSAATREVQIARGEISHAVPPTGYLENKGQYPAEVLFQTPYPGGVLWVTSDSLWYSFKSGLNLQLSFEGASRPDKISGQGLIHNNIHFYRGADPDGWIRHVPAWEEVLLAGIYPGTDLQLAWRGNAPAAYFRSSEAAGDQDRQSLQDTRVISAVLRGVEGPPEDLAPVMMGGQSQLSVRAMGEEHKLLLPGGDLPWRLHLETSGGIAKTFTIEPGANLPAGPPSPALTPVDAGLFYSTFLGSSLWDQADAVGYDGSANIYLAGHTLGLDFPAEAGYSQEAHNVDAFAASLDPTSGQANYIVVFQGSDLLNGEEYATGLDVTAAGEAYIVGRTDSSDFPTTLGAYDTSYNGNIDAFALKLDPAGGLVYSTYLGAGELDLANAVQVDGGGAVVLAGGTFSPFFPVTSNAGDPSINGLRDIFVSKLSPDGSELVYSTFLGGGSQEQAEDIALGSSGSVFLTGWTNSADFPATSGS